MCDNRSIAQQALEINEKSIEIPARISMQKFNVITRIELYFYWFAVIDAYLRDTKETVFLFFMYL